MLPASPHDTREHWRLVRDHLNRHRYDLSERAVQALAVGQVIPGTPLLARHQWIPGSPVPLERVRLNWQADAPPVPIDGSEPELDAIRPLRDDGTAYTYYADAVGDLARPRLFENRGCYRLLDVRTDQDGPALTFGRGQYFDVINICEAAAHEFASATLGAPGEAVPHPAQTPFRSAVGDPTDLARRPVMAATSTLTIRHDRTNGTAEFVLHWRDPGKVASGGGLYQVMPVGMFQSSHDASWNEANDFDLWRSIARELSEELLGDSEDYGSATAPIDYGAWPLMKSLDQARHDGTLNLYWLGLGMDPLTFVTDMLTVAVFDSELFDDTFRHIVSTNDEGHRVQMEDGTGHTVGIPFRADHIDRLTTNEPMQPAGAALLRLAWQHRDALLRV